MEVLTFGRITEITGSSFSVDAVADTAALRERLEEMFPVLASTKYIIAVDKKMTTENTAINESAVIALLPPFSGG